MFSLCHTDRPLHSVNSRMSVHNKIVSVPNKIVSVPNKIAHKTFKERRSLATRTQEASGIRLKFPRKLPIIVERFRKEVLLPCLDKTKFLVPDDMTMSQFASIVRNRLRLKPTQAFYLLVSNRCMTSLSRTMAEVYWEHKDGDGFLYVAYTAQEMYG